MPSPKVSIVLLTYNHEQFIEQALDSVLQQQAGFAYEIIVGEDYSTDRTRALVEAYRHRFPHQVKPIYQTHNLGPGANLRTCLAACQGQYLAVLEGDDYWTDALKLARQVQWLDEHPDFAICFHSVETIYHGGEEAAHAFPQEQKDVYTFDDFLIYTVPHTGSIVLRNPRLALPAWLFSSYPLDFPLLLLYAETGRAKRLPEAMSRYRVHAGGTWSSASYRHKQEQFLAMYQQLVSHYAPTTHANELRYGFSKQYLNAADSYTRRGLPQDAIRMLKKAAVMWRSYTPRHLKSFLGVAARWVRSLSQQPA